jgi:hypothetical protein
MTAITAINHYRLASRTLVTDVDYGRTRTGLTTDTLSIQHHLVVVQDFPSSVVTQPAGPNGRPSGMAEMLRQHTPRTAATQHK